MSTAFLAAAMSYSEATEGGTGGTEEAASAASAATIVIYYIAFNNIIPVSTLS